MTNPMASSYFIHDKSSVLFMLNPCASMAEPPERCCIETGHGGESRLPGFLSVSAYF